MATTSISKNIAAPKKRARGLIITRVAFLNAKTLLAAGSFYIFFIALVVGLIYPSMANTNITGYLNSNAVASLVGIRLKDPSGFSAFLGLELYSSLYALIWGGIIAYVAGSALPATIENGTIDLALGRPISRTRYFLELWLSAILGALFLSLTTVIAVRISTLFVPNANVNWGWLGIAEAVELAFMFLASGLGMLFGSFISASRAAGGAAVGIIALAYLMNTVGSLSDHLSWMLKVEPIYYTQSIQALVGYPIMGWYPVVLVGAGLICGIAGLMIFNRRDLPST